jgi:predicted RNA-binding Zn ribbon-like protein
LALNGTRESERHRLIGGALCLNFVNTVNGHRLPPLHEYLHDHRDLVLWSRHAGLVGDDEASRMARQARARPASAARAFRHALALREVMFHVFDSIARGRAPARGDLDRLNAAWRAAQRHAGVALTARGFAVRWDDAPSLDQITRAICMSAVDLLTSDRARRIRACAGDKCDWLFVDDSRNHLRRWCSMDECGNRAKMKRRQLRKRGALEGSTRGGL